MIEDFVKCNTMEKGGGAKKTCRHKTDKQAE